MALDKVIMKNFPSLNGKIEIHDSQCYSASQTSEKSLHQSIKQNVNGQWDATIQTCKSVSNLVGNINICIKTGQWVIWNSLLIVSDGLTAIESYLVRIVDVDLRFGRLCSDLVYLMHVVVKSRMRRRRNIVSHCFARRFQRTVVDPRAKFKNGMSIFISNSAGSKLFMVVC